MGDRGACLPHPGDSQIVGEFGPSADGVAGDKDFAAPPEQPERRLIHADVRLDAAEHRLSTAGVLVRCVERRASGAGERHLTDARGARRFEQRKQGLVSPPHARGVLLGRDHRDAQQDGYLDQECGAPHDPIRVHDPVQKGGLDVHHNEDAAPGIGENRRHRPHYGPGSKPWEPAQWVVAPTHLETFRRLVARRPTERLLYDLPVTGPVVDEIERHLGTRDVTRAFDLSFGYVYPRYRDDPRRWAEAFERIGFRLPARAEIGFAGVTHVVPRDGSTGRATHLREMLHPLAVIRSVEELESLPWPETADGALFAHLPADVRRYHEEGRVAVGGMECTVFELAWYLRGMDDLFLDLVEETGIADRLLDYFMERAMHAVRAYVRAGVDCVRLGDDVGTQRGMMMSVDFWRTHLKGRLRNVIRAIRDEGGDDVWVCYHSDGDIREILDDLIEIGVDAINPLQPECMPVLEVAARYGDRLGFWGMIGTQTTMPFGTPNDVRRAVDQVADLVRSGCPAIAAPTHVLEPDVPWANIQAFVEAAQDTRIGDRYRSTSQP